jgi:hypothetical protein
MAQKEVFSYFQDLTARIHTSFESLSNTILKENFISFRIAIATRSNKYTLLSHLCKHHFWAAFTHVINRCIMSLSAAIAI